jgi:4-methyl-5(b-hydroxyethyl)-thiazole monophosphate biosynthesis
MNTVFKHDGKKVMTMSRVCIFLAQGFEEIEGLTVVDLMRRAEIPITMVSIGDSLEVTGAHGIRVTADAYLADMDFSDTEMLVLPGGAPGTCNLNACEPLKALLKDFYEQGRYIAAICAAPMIFGQLGFLKNRKATCYPGFEEYLDGAEHLLDTVVVDETVITSRGLGTAIDFAAALITLLTDAATAEEITKSVIYTKEK